MNHIKFDLPFGADKQNHIAQNLIEQGECFFHPRLGIEEKINDTTDKLAQSLCYCR